MKHKNLEKVFSLLVLLLPFLYQYKGIGSVLSLGEVLLAAVLAAGLLNQDYQHFKVKISYGLLYLTTILTTLLCAYSSYFSPKEAMTLIARLLFYALVIAVGRRYFNLDSVLRLYDVLVCAFSLYLIVQFLFHLAFGGYLPIYLKSSWQFPPEARSSSMSLMYRHQFRPSSLFLEPSYFAFFVLPDFSLLLFRRKKGAWEYSALLVMLIAIVLSTAFSAIAGVLLAFFFYGFFRMEKKKGAKAAMRIFGIGIVLLALGIGLLNQGNSVWIKRISAGGSFFQRIWRGVLIFRQYPLLHKWIGVGLNNLDSFVTKYQIVTPYDETNLNYGASLLQSLLFSGILGSAALLLLLCAEFAESWRSARQLRRNPNSFFEPGCIISLFFLLLFDLSFEAVLFSYRFAFLILLLTGLRKSCAQAAEQALQIA